MWEEVDKGYGWYRHHHHHLHFSLVDPVFNRSRVGRDDIGVGITDPDSPWFQAPDPRKLYRLHIHDVPMGQFKAANDDQKKEYEKSIAAAHSELGRIRKPSMTANRLRFSACKFQTRAVKSTTPRRSSVGQGRRTPSGLEQG